MPTGGDPMPCERPSNGCRRVVERRVAGEARRCETRCQEFQLPRVTPQSDCAAPGMIMAAIAAFLGRRPSSCRRALSREVTARPSPVLRRPDRIPPWPPPFPGGEPETRTSVGRTTNRVRALTGIRIGSLSMPRIEARRHRPIAATPHPIQHKAHHRRIHSLYKIQTKVCSN